VDGFAWINHLTIAAAVPFLVACAAGLFVLTALFEFSLGNRELAIRKRRNRFRHGHASVLLYKYLIRPNLIKNANGTFMAMYEMRAPDASQYSAEELAAADMSISRGISQFNSQMVVHCHQRNDRYREYDMRESTYPHPVLEWLERRRQAFFMSGKCFRTRRIISICWEPASTRDQRLKAATSIGAEAAVANEDELIAEFEGHLADIEVFFSSHGWFRRLGVVRQADRFGIMRDRSEMLAHLSWCISGRDRNVNVPIPGQQINGLLAETFRGNFDVKVGEMETRIVVVKSFPDATYPLIFQRLADLGIDYSLVLRWMPQAGLEAKKTINDAYTEWTMRAQERQNVTDPHAIDMVESARQALGFLSSGGQIGITNIYVVLRGRDKAVVSQAARDVRALLDEIGFPSFIATLTAEDDYFASLPGDGYHGTRKFPLTAVNAAHIFSFHEESSGRRLAENPTLPRRQPALTYAVAGAGGTLYHLNLNDSPRDVSHFFGIGAAGSGKSTVLAHLAAQHVGRLPFGGFTGVDRGKSLYRLCRFLDGNFYEIRGEVDAPGFALFSDIEDDTNRGELLDMLEGFVDLQLGEVPGSGGKSQLRPHHRKSLEAAMNSMLEFPPELRSLTAYHSLLQDPDGSLKPALWHYTREGRLGRTLDCEQDTFSTGVFNVIEIQNIVNSAPKWLIPVLMTIFWKSRYQIEAMKRRHNNYDIQWQFQIDEAHTLLKHPLGEKFIVEELKLGRRAKRSLGLWTQSAVDFANSPVRDNLIEECHTRFFFRNLDVIESEEVRKAYGALGLPPRGIEWLPEIAQFNTLLWQPASRNMQELNMVFDRAWLAIIGRSREQDNRFLDQMILEHPETWREVVLRREGVPEREITELLQLIEGYKQTNARAGLRVDAA
jgi:type IV secretory pathway VirB4 component